MENSIEGISVEDYIEGNVEGNNGFHDGFHLSKSRIDRYATCPRSYQLYYELGIKPIRTAVQLLIGSATHQGIAAHYLAKQLGETENISEAIDKIWTQELGDNPTAAIKDELLTARTDSYSYTNLFLKTVSIEPIFIETRFEIPIVNLDNGDTLPIPLVGIVDLVDIPFSTGLMRPIEIKTRASKAPDYLPNLSLELTCYAYWIWQASQEENLCGQIPVGYIHIIKTKSPYIQRQEGLRGVPDFLELYAIAQNVYDSIMEKRFHQQSGSSCSWCDYLPVCSRQKDEIASAFGHEALNLLWEKELV
jgi:CRISPR/Cas system-associated exonuclease Cas4 (RecB family)